MKVSFCIPAYNEEARIAQCLASVQKEIVRAGMEHECEIVVVNNASTDRTGEIARGFAGITVIDEPRKGIAQARKTAYEHASGELIANVDSDTLLPPGWLDTAVQEFEKDPNLVALSGPFIFYDLPTFKRLVSQAFIATYPIAHFITHRILRVGAILQGGNFVLRRGALDMAGGFDPSFEFYGEDTDIARRISKFGRVKWTMRFPIYASGRRLAHEGMFRSAWNYTLNFVWPTITGKPWSTTHTDIRTP